MNNWHEQVRLAEHYIAIGHLDHHIFGSYNAPFDFDKPWEYVTEIKSGGLNLTWAGEEGLQVSTEVKFVALHPCGLEFRWDVEFLKPRVEGAYRREIDLELIDQISTHLTKKQRGEFVAICLEYCRKTSEATQRFANTVNDAVRRQREELDFLNGL